MAGPDAILVRGEYLWAVGMPILTDAESQIRLTEANYGDGIGTLAGDLDPVAISQLLFDQDGDIANAAGLSNMFTIWGQFIDHDLALTPESNGEMMTSDGLVAPVPRSAFAGGTDDPRVPLNAITWQLDGSQIYGSSAERMEDVRSFEEGKLKLSFDNSSDNGLLPKATPQTEMAGDITSDDPVYLAGDVRANENPNLLSLQTMMAREHNYWAEQLAQAHPDWDDQQLFEGARSIVEFEIQKVTYDQWLPHLVGDAVPEDYDYDPEADGQISVEFSTAAFRFGHTMISSVLDRLDDDGTQATGGSPGLMEAFFDHGIVEDGGIDPLIRGMLGNTAQELDTQVVDDLNFFLETPTGVSGFSLVALNLLRGQDHGLQNYVDTRAALLGDIDPDTLDPDDFSIITADPALQAQFASVFDSVQDIPLWVGGLAEDAVEGTQLGPLFTYIVAEQFIRTRAADETFGQLDPALGPEIIAQVMASGLADIIERTTDVDMVQDDPFVVAARNLDMAKAPAGTWGPDQMDLVAQDINDSVRSHKGDDSIDLSGGTQLRGDLITGRGGDTVTASSGDIHGDIRTGDGDDKVTLTGTARVGGNIRTGAGNDVVTLSDMAGVARDIITGAGADTVTLTGRATVGDDIRTGGGDDTVKIAVGASVDGAVRLGGGDDTLTLAAGAQVGKISGGAGQDTLGMTGGRFRVDWGNGGPEGGNGTIVYLNADGTETGETTAFRSIEMVTCFTPTTRIIAAGGIRQIEGLQIGDQVWTLDAGLQPIRWIGQVTVPANGPFTPIRIAAGALGNSRDLTVSPQHRMMLEGWQVELHCGAGEVLAPAKGLVNDTTIRPAPADMVTYIHLMFDSHQIVMAEGIPSESFHPGQQALSAMDHTTRAEVLALFPELADNPAGYGPSARMGVTVREAQVLRE